jgi:hypothetical protein
MFPFCENMFVPGKFPVMVLPVILDIVILGEFYFHYIDQGAHFSLCVECDMD